MKGMGVSPWILLGLAAAVALASRTLFVADPGSLVLVQRFDRVIAEPTVPGVHLKWPFVDRVVRLDGRTQLYRSNPVPYRTADGQYVLVEATVSWRIGDARRFHAMAGGADDVMPTQLAHQLSRSLLEMMQKTTLPALLAQHHALPAAWPWLAEAQEQYGVNITAVRLSRLEPEGKSREAILERMRGVQEARASLTKMQGDKEVMRLQESADERAEAIVDAARKRSAILSGDGIVQALAILEPARHRAPELEATLQSMEVAAMAWQEKGAVWVITSDDPFFAQLLGRRQGVR
jgi:membrane protease subunit HflC